MGLSRRCPRLIRRALPVAAVLFFIATAINNSHTSSARSVIMQQSSPNRLWMAAGRIFPHPHQRVRSGLHANASQAPLMSESNQELMNATFVSLVRNSEVQGMLRSIQDVEARSNHAYHYDWIFLNDDDFTGSFKVAITAAVSGRSRFGNVRSDDWSYPTGMDQQFAENARQQLAEGPTVIPHAAEESYRHMCSFQSGFFYRYPLVLNYH